MRGRGWLQGYLLSSISCDISNYESYVFFYLFIIIILSLFITGDNSDGDKKDRLGGTEEAQLQTTVGFRYTGAVNEVNQGFSVLRCYYRITNIGVS